MGSNIHIARESPRYPVGFGIAWPMLYYFILKRINAERTRMSVEEVKAKYTHEELADMGDESPLFKYAT